MRVLKTVQPVVLEMDRRKRESRNRNSFMFRSPQSASVIPPASNPCHFERFMVNVDGASIENKGEGMAAGIVDKLKNEGFVCDCNCW